MPVKKKALIILGAVILVFLVIAIITQAVSIYKIRNEQKLKFQSLIAGAAHALEQYKETGHAFQYQEALMELHSAASIALLLQDEDNYKGVHEVLLSIVGTYHSFPEDLALFTDELIDVLQDFDTHHNVENLYTKLNTINNRLTALLAERLKTVE